MKHLSLLILLLLGWAGSARAQGHVSKQQQEAASAFLNHLVRGEYDAGWGMVDDKLRTTSGYESYTEAAKQITAIGEKLGKDIEPYMNGLRMVPDYGTTYVYSFKFSRDVTKGAPSALLEVVFMDSVSTKIAGFAPRIQLAATKDSSGRISTSPSQEDLLEGAQTWKIGDSSYKINELALIHFGEYVMLAVKIIHPLPQNVDMTRAKIIAQPVANYAFEEGYYKKALKAAKKQKLKLIENIGVAIIPEGSDNGYRVQFSPDEYQ